MFRQISFIVVDIVTQEPLSGAEVYVDHAGYVVNGGMVIVPLDSTIYHKAKVGYTWSEKTSREIDETWAQCTYIWDGVGFSPPNYE
jgi:hypothetical protein